MSPSIFYWHLIREGVKSAYDIVGQEKCEVDFVVCKPGKKGSYPFRCVDIGDETTNER